MDLTNKNTDWETKIIPYEDILKIKKSDIDSILKEHRDWMLGGKNMEWRYSRDKITSGFILQRR